MTGEFRTVTVIKSGASATADGRVALVLHTREVGTIAFEVDQQAIDVIRRDLLACENVLKSPKGKA
jgi:hypothetical protein